MFSDRFWILKVAAALSLLAWLCQSSRKVLPHVSPDVEQTFGNWESIRDRRIMVWAKKVVSAEPGAFEIETQEGPVRVLSSRTPSIGEFVTVYARPVGPRTIQADSFQTNPGFAWKRPLNYVVSILTLVAYLFFIRRRFRGRMSEGVFRSRY